MSYYKDFLVGKNLVDFFNLLRQLGVRISLAEILDAFQTFEHVKISNQKYVKTALKCSVIKRQEDLPLFDQAFNTFFAPPEQKNEWKIKKQQKDSEIEQQIAQAESDLSFQGQSLNLSRREKISYANLENSAQEKIQDFLSKSSAGTHGEKDFRPMIENLVRGQLAYWQHKGEQMPPLPVETGNQEIDYLLEQVQENLRELHSKLLHQDIKSISEADSPAALKLIHHLSKKLATKISRRYKQSSKQSVIDLRRSIRKNIASGGTMFKLHYKSKKITKPQLFLLCDVSWSMTKYTKFILQFSLGLTRAINNMETFLFAEKLERTTSWFQKGVSFEEIMAMLGQGREVWGQGTDLNQSLKELENKYRSLLKKNTIVIIVSDTKTVAVPKTAQRIQSLQRKVKQILWLNTLPQNTWEKHSSVAAFQPYCKMYECNTIKDLERIISSQLLDN
ncbi:MAG: vWA domain-containing protein [Bacillota bacterium]